MAFYQNIIRAKVSVFSKRWAARRPTLNHLHKDVQKREGYCTFEAQKNGCLLMKCSSLSKPFIRLFCVLVYGPVLRQSQKQCEICVLDCGMPTDRCVKGLGFGVQARLFHRLVIFND